MLSAGGSVTSGMPRSREVQLGQLQEAFNGLCRQVGVHSTADCTLPAAVGFGVIACARVGGQQQRTNCAAGPSTIPLP